MSRYSKYILSRTIAPMILIALTLTGIVWLTQSLRFVDLIVNRGLSVSTFLYLSSLLIPSLFNIVMPISLFVAIAFAYNRLNTDSELVVLKSAGVSKFALIRPALYLAIIITILGYLISFYLLPASFREFKDLQSFIRDNYVSVLLQEGVFNSPTKELTVYVRDRTEQGLLRGIVVHDSRIPGKPITMMAQSGQLIQTPTGPRFVLVNGNRQEVTTSTGQLSLLSFDRYALDLSLFAKVEQKRWREPQERYLNELFTPQDDADAEFKPRLLAEAHHRITWPLYNIALCLLALTPFIMGQFNRRGQTKRIFVAACFSLALVGVGTALNNIVANNLRLIPSMYVASVATILFVLYLLLRNPRKRRKRRPA